MPLRFLDDLSEVLSLKPDLLAAVRYDGIDRVIFRSTKPPRAWLGTAAEKALAGVGFERMAIELVADPEAGGNRNEILAEGPFGRFEIRMLGKTRPEAPRTSISAPLSIVRGVLNRSAGIVV